MAMTSLSYQEIITAVLSRCLLSHSKPEFIPIPSRMEGLRVMQLMYLVLYRVSGRIVLHGDLSGCTVYSYESRSYVLGNT